MHFAFPGDGRAERLAQDTQLHLSDPLREIGIHSFLFRATVVTNGEKVYDSTAALILGHAPTLMAGYRLEHSFVTYHGGISELDHHPNYLVRRPHLTTPGGGEIIEVAITPDSNEEEIRRAHDLDLTCITRWGGCETVADLMPSAAIYRDPFEEGNQQYHGCSLTRLARDSVQVLLAEVKSVDQYRGDWSEPGTQTVRYKLIKTLKGDNANAPDITEVHHPIQFHSLTASSFEPGLSRDIFSPGRKLVLAISRFDQTPNADCGVLPADSAIVESLEKTIQGLAEVGIPAKK